MMKRTYTCLAAGILAIALCMGSMAEEPTRILFLSKSSGFEHSAIRWEEGKPSHVDGVLEELAAQINAEVTSTKDASTINAENLENYDVVIFYTTGDLTEEGNDGHPPMREEGLDELLAWVRNGGGLLGFHSASDTFHRNANPHAPESPFLEMLGGEFLTHGPQFMGRLITVSTEHPTMEGIPEDWEIHDEWYCFEHLSEDRMHVLALLDSREQRELQLRHNLPNYPIIWCSSEGDGRVYYNAMGHREDVWDNETFQRMVTNAINWAKGDGPTMTEPNYAEHMPISIKPVGR